MNNQTSKTAAISSQPKEEPPCIDALKLQLKEQSKQLKRAQEKIHNQSIENNLLSARIVGNERNLDIARKKLLSLQPPQDISDDVVRQAFDDLRENIEEWVEIECGALMGLKEHLSSGDWTHQEMWMVEQHITEDDINLSVLFPNVSANIIMSAIFSFLYDYYLREERWILCTPVEEVVLNDLVCLMAKHRASREPQSIFEFQSGLHFSTNPQLRRWRKEVIQALIKEKERIHQRKANTKTSARELSWVLKHFVDQGNKLNFERLQHKVFEPAYNLAELIKTSSKGYRFDFMANSSSPVLYPTSQGGTAYTLVDAETGTEIDTIQTMEGSVGKLRLCVFPGLETVRETGERVCLSRGVVVLDRSVGHIEKSTADVSQGTDGKDGPNLMAPRSAEQSTGAPFMGGKSNISYRQL